MGKRTISGIMMVVLAVVALGGSVALAGCGSKRATAINGPQGVVSAASVSTSGFGGQQPGNLSAISGGQISESQAFGPGGGRLVAVSSITGGQVVETEALVLNIAPAVVTDNPGVASVNSGVVSVLDPNAGLLYGCH